MYSAIGRAARFVLSPREAWLAAAQEIPAPFTIFGTFLCPLACIPAVCWTLGRMLSAGDPVQDPRAGVPSAAQLLHGGLSVIGCALLSVTLLAAALYALAPLFARPRDWPRAFQVASYSSAPLFLGGILLLLPEASFVLLLAVFHSAYLLYGGVQSVLGVREDRAAEYVALGTVALVAASTVLGGVGGALGIL
jgi:hypothetical protein